MTTVAQPEGPVPALARPRAWSPSSAVRLRPWPWLPTTRTALVGTVLAVVAALLALVAGRATPSGEVGGYGIITALPAAYWIAIALAAIATALLLTADRMAALVPALWLVCLHTAPATAHAGARLPAARSHSGFVHLLAERADAEIQADARFAWPGFFAALSGPMSELSPTVLDWLLRLWPTLVIGATAVLVAGLARRAYPGMALVGPLSALVYVIGSWVGRDHFSPQSVGVLFYLSVVLVMESGPLGVAEPQPGRAGEFLGRFVLARGDRPEAATAAPYVAMLILGLGSVVLHPLAPFAICGALAVLGLYGRMVAWRLLMTIGLAFIVWVLVVAQPWWSTPLDDLIDQVGTVQPPAAASAPADAGADIDPGASPTAATGPTAARVLVSRTRFALVALTVGSVVVLGSVVATDRLRRLRPAVPLVPLAAVGLVAAGTDGYGGDLPARMLLYALPAAAVVVARAVLVPGWSGLPVLLAVGLVAATPPFLVARYGNESFEMVTATDRAAVEVLHAAAVPGTVVVADNPHLPWAGNGWPVGRYRYVEAEPGDAWIQRLRDEATRTASNRVLVILTTGQSAWRHQVEGAPPDWLDEAGAWLAAQPGTGTGTEVLHNEEGSWVLLVDPTVPVGTSG